MPAAPVVNKLGKAMRIIRETGVHAGDRHQWRNEDRERVQETVDELLAELQELAAILRS